MAKSLRASSKKKYRSLKRDDRMTVEDERLARLHARLLARQKLQPVPESSAMQEDEEEEEDAGVTDTMEVDKKKISTSGSRGSARENWKGGKFLKKKRAKSVLSDRRKRK